MSKVATKKARPRKAGDASVMARVKRETNALARSVAQALGLEGVSNADGLKEKLSEIQQKREEGMSETERSRSKMQLLAEQLEQTKTQLSRYQQGYAKVKQERDSLRDDYDMLQVETTIKEAAREAGVVNQDYAMHLFRNHCLQGDDAEYSDNPGGFFESLKSSENNKHIFSPQEVVAGPQAAAQTQEVESSDPVSNLPPQPDPAPQGSNGVQLTPDSGEDLPDASQMDYSTFQKHAEDKYGFRPSR